MQIYIKGTDDFMRKDGEIKRSFYGENMYTMALEHIEEGYQVFSFNDILAHELGHC